VASSLDKVTKQSSERQIIEQTKRRHLLRRESDIYATEQLFLHREGDEVTMESDEVADRAGAMRRHLYKVLSCLGRMRQTGRQSSFSPLMNAVNRATDSSREKVTTKQTTRLLFSSQESKLTGTLLCDEWNSSRRHKNYEFLFRLTSMLAMHPFSACSLPPNDETFP
jgi:hypothetical protein